MDKLFVTKTSTLANEIKAKFEELHKLSKEYNENIKFQHSIGYSNLYISCDINDDVHPDFFWSSSGC